MFYVDCYRCPIGKLIIVVEGDALVAIDFENSKYCLKDMQSKACNNSIQIVDSTKQWLQEYFSKKIPSFTPNIKLMGSSFRLAVWNLLLQIPYGRTCSYGEIAKIIAKEKGIEHMSAQAVGQAVGHNPISIIVPCHRVIGARGELTGYAGGLDRKKFLLELEGKK